MLACGGGLVLACGGGLVLACGGGLACIVELVQVYCYDGVEALKLVYDELVRVLEMAYDGDYAVVEVLELVYASAVVYEDCALVL